MKKHKLIVISGPSGSGKTTICDRLVDNIPDLQYSISFTTRKPRSGEENGRDYFFVSEPEFKKRIQEGRFAEYAEVFDHYYGTDKQWLKDQSNNILLNIDVKGASQIKSNFPEATFIFLMPPDIDSLRQRLYSRGADSEQEIAKRLAKAKEEMAQASNYDYVIINDTVEKAVAKIRELIEG